MEAKGLSREQLVELVTKITMEVLRRSEGEAQPPAAYQVALEPCSCEGTNMADCTSCGYCVVLRSDVKDILEAGASRISSRPGISGVDNALAGMIDHTLLKPDTNQEALHKICEEARQHHFASVCVNPSNVKYCAQQLTGSGVKIAAVVGFPLGASTSNIKAQETHEVIADGATEIDMVINIGALKSGDFATVFRDIQTVVEAAHGATVKVIIETALLDETEKIIACAMAKAAGAHFVKTSTGFGPKGATTEDVALMRRVVGPKMGVKASGGIRDRETAEKMIAAGATRIGASASVAIVEGGRGGTGY